MSEPTTRLKPKVRDFLHIYSGHDQADAHELTADDQTRNLADFECPHGSLPSDRTLNCTCFNAAA